MKKIKTKIVKTTLEKNVLWLVFSIFYKGKAYDKTVKLNRKTLGVKFMEACIDDLAIAAKECLGASLGFEKYKEYHKLEEMVQK